MEKLGVEKIEQIAEALKEVAILGKKISADGKVSFEDAAHLIAFAPKAAGVVAAFKDLGQAVDQIKDIDVSEVISLINSIDAKIKEIEKI